MSNDNIKVWDPMVRLFHWSLVMSFTVSYISEDDLLDLHVLSGYLIGGLLLFRLVWGMIGPHHARFSSFVHRPRVVGEYLKDILAFQPRRYLGHNPAGGWMVVMLMISLALATVTGLVTYGAEEMAGPLAGAMAGSGRIVGDAFEEMHEFFANFTLLLVIVHVAGVILASLQHRENLVRAMFDGRKRVME
ncbi:MAG: cytochrome B [Proteobacteria bacterium]|nr:MAG: cytochrome B [Pseudomonadota bacterium]QKK12467.1 MAG: cytochrome B [Pseudomonadota bacterium]